MPIPFWNGVKGRLCQTRKGRFMQYIADSYLEDPAWPTRRRLPRFSRTATIAMLLGALSVVLYVLLYRYSGEIRYLAMEANRGHHGFFLTPIVIAFVFSIVHGLFTDRFWEAVGLRAKH